MTKQEFITQAKKYGDVTVELDTIYVDVEDDAKYMRFYCFINKLGIPFKHYSLSDDANWRDIDDDVITYEIDANAFSKLNVVSVWNKTTGVIKTKGFTRKVGPQSIYTMIESVRAYPNDRILIEIMPNVESFDDYHPFKL